MNENLALLLAVLYLIYRFKTYKKTNKIIEDRIENVPSHTSNVYEMF